MSPSSNNQTFTTLGYSSASEQEQYVHGAMKWLEGMTQQKITEIDRAMWVRRLSRYPKWRLGELSDYIGRLTNDVFHYLDGLQRRETNAPKLPAPETRFKVNNNLVKDSLAHIKHITNHNWRSREEREEWEVESLMKLAREYPSSWQHAFETRTKDINSRKQVYTDRKLESAGQ